MDDGWMQKEVRKIGGMEGNEKIQIGGKEESRRDGWMRRGEKGE